MIGLASFIPHNLAVKAALYALVFFLGMALGNLHATKRIADEIQGRADAQFAAATNALAEETKRRDAEAAARLAVVAEADRAAHDEIATGVSAAAQARDAALAQLARERTRNKELGDAYVNVLGAVDSVRCSWSSNARRVLDAASGANPADSARPSGDTVAASTGGTPGPATAGPCLTDDDLYRGYAALGEWARNATAKDQAWREWAGKTLSQ